MHLSGPQSVTYRKLSALPLGGGGQRSWDCMGNFSAYVQATLRMGLQNPEGEDTA